MNAVVLGAGSIGRRHVMNLSELGVDVSVVDLDHRRADEVAVAGRGTPIDRQAVDQTDLVVVATPTICHAADLLWAIGHTENVFVEKPLAATRVDLADLRSRLTARTRLMVGCNLRFTDGFQALAAVLPSLGRIVSMTIDYGWWLPAWRPQSDYREQYSARKDLGGGIVMDAIHEIDYALALAGPAVGVASRLSRSGLLEIDVEDVADISLRHSGGAQSAIHLDYLRRRYTRSCTVISERGEARWDFAAGRLEVCDDPGGEVRLAEFEDRVDTNAPYVAEMRHFLDCIAAGTPSVNGFEEAAVTTETALRALEANAG